MFFCEWLAKTFCSEFPKRLTEAVIFSPPQPPTYYIVLDKNNDRRHKCDMYLKPAGDCTDLREVWCHDCRYVRTSFRKKIVVIHIKATRGKTPFTILYSHGNAWDLGMAQGYCRELSQRTGCNVVSYDYSGYGRSTGDPSEKNLYADIAAAFKYTLTHHEPNPLRIVLVGSSLGCAATVDLASKVRCAGVVLESAFISTCRIISSSGQKSCFDAMNSIDKLPLVQSPVLVIHGTRDKMIDISHAQTIHECCPMSVEPLWVEGGGHNLEIEGAVEKRLRKFINKELVHFKPYR